jgi:hypothetical protein
MKTSIQNNLEQYENYELKVKTYSQTELLNTTTELFTKEKKIDNAILILLSEIQNRRIYAVLGFSSLFEMLVKHFNLSESSAYQRISLIKLIQDVPVAKSALVEDRASMSNLVLASSFINEQNKNSKKMTVEEKTNVIEIVKTKSYKEAKEVLALLNPQPVIAKDKSIIISKTQTNLHFTIDNELQKKLDHIKNLISHKNAKPSMNELLAIMADITIEQLEKKKGINKKVHTSSKHCVTIKPNQNDPPSHLKIRSRYISKNVRREVYQKAQGQCEYVSPEGNRCQCRKFLQYEHTTPFSKGGLNNIATLVLFCSEHNALRAKQEFGVDPRFYKR